MRLSRHDLPCTAPYAAAAELRTGSDRGTNSNAVPFALERLGVIWEFSKHKGPLTWTPNSVVSSK